jgi:RNA polymerase sigma-70 factor (ECF subfamily)
MKIIISELQLNKIKSYNNPGVNLIINNFAGKNLEPLSEGWLNTLADLVGIVDPTGIVDIGNAISYWTQGRKTFSLLSLLSAIPGADFITKPFMLGGKVIAGASRMSILGTLLRSVDTWGGKALNKLDKLALSKIPIVKNFANGMKTFILGLKKSSKAGLKESTDTIKDTSQLNFDKIYSEYYPKILKYVCMKYANGDNELAQDFCQNGFIKVYNNLNKYGGGSLGAWISRTITNNILDELRKKRIQSVSGFDFGRYEVEDDEYDDNFFGGYTEDDIKAAIESLPKSYKKVFVMYYIQGMSHKEIADELGINEGTSKSNLFKAKAKVKSFLEDLNKKRDY